MSVGADEPDVFAALRITNFRRYILALFTLTLGVQIQGTIVGWQIYDLTRDPLALGLVGLAEALPAISMSLFAGHVADSHDRRRITLCALAVLVLCSVALLTLAGPSPLGATLASPARVHAIYAVIVASGVARSFLQPARQALSAELVPRSLFGNAVTWRSGSWQLAAVLGPALGGVLYAIGGSVLGYAVDVGLMVVATLVMLLVRHRSPVRDRTSREPIGQSLTSGLRFVFREPVLLGALTLDLFSVLFGGATALLPVFAAEILLVGPTGLGILRAAPAVGAVITSVALARWGPFRRAGPALLVTVAGFGACMIGFGLSRSFALSVALLAASGAFDMVSVVIRSLMLQIRTPEAMLGRVSSVNQIFIGSSNEIGAFESGVAARAFGTAQSVVLGGIATLLVVGAVAWRMPMLRRLREIKA
ncbi:MAG TPA: MFS transporter [Gemmatimonas sp.]|nr:MFS transporter [Gemmatimonas sp.]